MKKTVNGLGAAVATVVLSGCTAIGQPDFSCNGMPGNVTCMDSLTVYELTNDPALDAAVRAEVARLSAEGETNIDTKAVIASIKQTRNYTQAGSTTLMAALSQPMPVLEPARVVRIWVAPWIDNKGDLHMPGYLFSEITPRRWSFGEAEVGNTRVLTPMQVERDVPREGTQTTGKAAPAATKGANGAAFSTAQSPPPTR
jgi:conjugal transfer pilus assembly protein TraV